MPIFFIHLVVLVGADDKKISKGTIVAIVVAPVVVIALGFALWKRRKAYKAFTSDCEFLVFQKISSKCFFFLSMFFSDGYYLCVTNRFWKAYNGKGLWN